MAEVGFKVAQEMKSSQGGWPPMGEKEGLRMVSSRGGARKGWCPSSLSMGDLVLNKKKKGVGAVKPPPKKKEE
ncbi:hypothetical protein NL676_020859 [Syzygium grande]|nr:hypothetical protein NL676_020859 [Syzygium grande]